MNATVAVFHGYTLPLELVEHPIPSLRDGETLVKINCCALCRSDLHTYEGRRTEATPTILGHEAVGTVVESRAGLSNGTRVTWAIFASCSNCFFCSRGLPQKCASLFKYGHARLSQEQPISGGLATHILLRRGTTIVPIPDSLPDETAVLANCSTATAFASTRCAELRTGSVVAILGLGVLGLTTAAILSSQGHTVVAFDPDSGKANLAAQFGCCRSFSNRADFIHAINELTDERGADACLELSGSQSAAELSLDCVRIGATVIWTGAAAPIGEITIQPEHILRRQLTIKGVHNYVPSDLEDAVDFLHETSREYPWVSLIGSQYELNNVKVPLKRRAPRRTEF